MPTPSKKPVKKKPAKKKAIKKKPSRRKADKRKKVKKKRVVGAIIKQPEANTEGGANGSTGWKRNTAQRERDLRDITKWWLQGVSQLEMARRISEDTDPTRNYTITNFTVFADIKLLTSRWEKDSEVIHTIERIKTKQLRRLDLLMAETFIEWERSKGDKVKQTQKKVEGNGGESSMLDRNESTVTIEPQFGSPALMGKLIDIVDRQNRVLGIYDLDAPKIVPQKIDYHMTFEHADPSAEILERQKRATGVIDIEAKIIDAKNADS